MAVDAGSHMRDHRLRKALTIRHLSDRTGVSPGTIHAVESGKPAELETYARVAAALELRPAIEFADARRRRAPAAPILDEDFVHAAMGEVEALTFSGHGFEIGLDEPYQHYQFAGRADLIAWDRDHRALLHLENRTRFPDVQDAAGSYNAKRAYLAAVLSRRLGLGPRGCDIVTHAMVALWSSEALHTIRLREATFRALCPDASDSFAEWWAGRVPVGSEV